MSKTAGADHVIYESMEVEFTTLNVTHPDVDYTSVTFDVEGKRGVVTMKFALKEDGEVIGTGTKRMIATGLKPYEQDAIDELVTRFTTLKEQFFAQYTDAA